MSCFGKLCATEASRKPKKTYNDLVPEVFASEAPDWRAPIDARTTRQLGKIQEYVYDNVQRAPKVSRRLWRRLLKEHGNRKMLGNVKVVVHAYFSLMAGEGAGNVTLYAKELLINSDGVIPVLLSHRGPAAEQRALTTLGLELVAQFLRAQVTTEYAGMASEHVSKSCSILSSQGQYGAEQVAAALRVLREYLAFSRRLTIGCANLDLVHTCAMDWLHGAAEPEAHRVLDVAFVKSLSHERDFTSAEPAAVAEEVLEHLVLVSADSGIGAKVVSATLQKMTECHLWGTETRRKALRVLRTALEARDAMPLLLLGLLGHLSRARLEGPDLANAAAAAAEQVQDWPKGYAVPSIVQAVELLSPVLVSHAVPAPSEQTTAAVERCIHTLVAQAPDSELLLEAVEALLVPCRPSVDSAVLARIKCVQMVVDGMARPNPADKSAPSDYVPASLLLKLHQFSALPTTSPANSGVAMSLCIAANRFLTALLDLGWAPLPAADASTLQNSLSRQLSRDSPHSAPQLTSVGNAFLAAIPRTPWQLQPRACGMLVRTLLQGNSSGGDDGRNADVGVTVETLFVADKCVRGLCRHWGVDEPDALMPAGACMSISADPGTLRLTSTGTESMRQAASVVVSKVTSPEAIQRYIEQFTHSLSQSHVLKEAGLELPADSLTKFDSMQDDSATVLDAPDAPEDPVDSSTGPSLPKIKELQVLFIDPGVFPPSADGAIPASPQPAAALMMHGSVQSTMRSVSEPGSEFDAQGLLTLPPGASVSRPPAAAAAGLRSAGPPVQPSPLYTSPGPSRLPIAQPPPQQTASPLHLSQQHLSHAHSAPKPQHDTPEHAGMPTGPQQHPNPRLAHTDGTNDVAASVQGSTSLNKQEGHFKAGLPGAEARSLPARAPEHRVSPEFGPKSKELGNIQEDGPSSFAALPGPLSQSHTLVSYESRDGDSHDVHDWGSYGLHGSQDASRALTRASSGVGSSCSRGGGRRAVHVLPKPLLPDRDGGERDTTPSPARLQAAPSGGMEGPPGRPGYAVPDDADGPVSSPLSYAGSTTSSARRLRGSLHIMTRG